MATPLKNEEKKEEKSLFQQCYEIDCADIIRDNYSGIKYISWADAWVKLKLHFPQAWFSIHHYGPDEMPFLKTEVGYFVTVTVGLTSSANDTGDTQIEMLPVMDNKMHAIEKPDARDINDTIKRCLVKAIALHGLGLSVYEKDDPHATSSSEQRSQQPVRTNASAKDGEFRFPFGKLKGKTFNECDPKELGNWIRWLESMPESQQKHANIFKAYNAWISALSKIGGIPLEDVPPNDEDYPEIPF